MTTADAPTVLVDGRTPTVRSLHPFLFGYDGHFTAMQVRNRGVRGLDLHLERLRAAHREVYGSDLDPDRVRHALARAVADRPDADLRLTATESDAGVVHLMTVARAPIAQADAPVALSTTPWSRGVAHIKHVGGFPQWHYRRQAHRDGFDDVLFVDGGGLVGETSFANIAFLGPDGVDWPVAPVLPGIAWLMLERTLPAAGIATRRTPIRLTDLRRYTGAVLTNSIGVTPVSAIGEHRFEESLRAHALISRTHDGIPFDPLV